MANNNFAQRIAFLLADLRRIYDQQGQTGKVVIPGVVLAFCCLCSVLAGVLSSASRRTPTGVPSPLVIASQASGATPTPLFNFGPVTFTPFPTFPAPTAFPTLTPFPTASETPTLVAPTETATSIPSATNPPATPTNSGSMTIIAVNKPLEYVDIQNLSSAAVDLKGWRLVSEMGSQSCTLRGTLQPNEVLRVWARTGDTGLSCGFTRNIWNDNTNDPAALYNPEGEVISRYP